MKSKWENVGGKRILYCDFSDFGTDVDALSAEIDAADEAILREARVKKQAIVGLSGIQKMLVQAVAWFSRETFVLFDTPDAARDWLAMDKGAGVVVKGA